MCAFVCFFWDLSFESDEIGGSKEKGYFHVLLFSVMVKKGARLPPYMTNIDHICSWLYSFFRFFSFVFFFIFFSGVVFLSWKTWSKRDDQAKHTRINQRMWVMIRFWRWWRTMLLMIVESFSKSTHSLHINIYTCTCTFSETTFRILIQAYRLIAPSDFKVKLLITCFKHSLRLILARKQANPCNVLPHYICDS